MARRLTSQPNRRGVTRRPRVPAAVAHYLQRTVAHATRRGYAADLRHFLGHGGKLPATERMVALYLARHADVLKVATLQRRLAALQWAHRERRLRSPIGTPLVRATMLGIRRANGTRQRQVSAIDKHLLARMLSAASGQARLAASRDRALLLVGFCGAFRRAELTAIEVADLTSTPSGLQVLVRRSKTDQTAGGRTVLLPYGRGHFCPVRALTTWLRVAGISTGATFRRIRAGDIVAPQRLCAQSVALVVKRLVSAAGGDATLYSAHSLRAGYVTLATQRGLTTSTIKLQTGHRSDAMIGRYMRGAVPSPPTLL